MAIRLVVGVAAAGFALVAGREAGRVAVLVLLVTSWVGLIVFVKLEEKSTGRSLGMWTLILLFGLGLLLLLLLLMNGT